jgi:ssDNA-binding Zn-finger/Zn-ribbon topoisomerase 1
VQGGSPPPSSSTGSSSTDGSASADGSSSGTGGGPPSNPRACPSCGTGRLGLKLSPKTGGFIGCSGYPACTYTRPLAPDAGPKPWEADWDEQEGEGEGGGAAARDPAEPGAGEGGEGGDAAGNQGPPRQAYATRQEELERGKQMAEELGVKGESCVGRGRVMHQGTMPAGGAGAGQQMAEGLGVKVESCMSRGRVSSGGAGAGQQMAEELGAEAESWVAHAWAM